MSLMGSFTSADRSFVQETSSLRAVSASLPSSVTYQQTAAERKRSTPTVELDLEANVVRRSLGELWFTVHAPRLNGNDVVVLVANSAGQLVYRSNPVRIENGERYDMVPVAEFESGQYFIRVIDPLSQTLASSRFLVVR
jgi:hypothetical protein